MHSSAVEMLLRGAHLVINARNEVRHELYSFGYVLIFSSKADVDPAVIISRVEAASGSKYIAQEEAPRRSEPIAPVGPNYKLIGKADIAALRGTPTPSVPLAARLAMAAASLYGRASAVSLPPSAPPAASRVPFPTTARPTFSDLVSQYRARVT